MQIDSGANRPNMAGGGPLHPIEAESRALTLGWAVIIGLVMALAVVTLLECIAAGAIH